MTVDHSSTCNYQNDLKLVQCMIWLSSVSCTTTIISSATSVVQEINSANKLPNSDHNDIIKDGAVVYLITKAMAWIEEFFAHDVLWHTCQSANDQLLITQ